MKARCHVLLRGWGKRVVLVSVVAVAFCLPLLQSASAAQSSTPVTQGELLRWLVHLRGEESTLPANAEISDYIQWARRHKIEPKGGWNPDAVLTTESFAEVLAQLYGLDTKRESASLLLEKEGIVIPAVDEVTRVTLVKVVDEFGFQSRAASQIEAPTTKIKGNNGVGNGLDPAPPGNPKPNDGPGTGPGNPGNKPPQP